MAAVTEQFANKPTRVQSSHRLVNMLNVLMKYVEYIISLSVILGALNYLYIVNIR